MFIQFIQFIQFTFPKIQKTNLTISPSIRWHPPYQSPPKDTQSLLGEQQPSGFLARQRGKFLGTTNFTRGTPWLPYQIMVRIQHFGGHTLSIYQYRIQHLYVYSSLQLSFIDIYSLYQSPSHGWFHKFQKRTSFRTTNVRPGDRVRYLKDLTAIFTMERSTIFSRYKPQSAINDKIEITFWIFPFVYNSFFFFKQINYKIRNVVHNYEFVLVY